MAVFTGVNHLAMATGDMDRTIRYWRDLVGLRLVAGLGMPGARQYFFRIATDSYLGFFEWADVEPIEEKEHGYPAKGPLVFDHVALGVAGDEDLWELRDKLEAAGFWVSEPLDHGFIHSIYSFDPNGIAVEFSATAPGVDLGARPVMVERAPGPVALEGPEQVPGQWPSVDQPTPADERRVYPGEGLALVQGRKRNWFENA